MTTRPTRAHRLAVVGGQASRSLPDPRLAGAQGLTDEQLVKLSRERDSVAFEALYRGTPPSFSTWRHGFRGSSNEIDDVVHDAFLRAYQKSGRAPRGRGVPGLALQHRGALECARGCAAAGSSALSAFPLLSQSISSRSPRRTLLPTYACAARAGVLAPTDDGRGRPHRVDASSHRAPPARGGRGAHGLFARDGEAPDFAGINVIWSNGSSLPFRIRNQVMTLRKFDDLPSGALRDHGTRDRVDRIWQRLEGELETAAPRSRVTLWWVPAAAAIIFGAGVVVGSKWARPKPLRWSWQRSQPRMIQCRRVLLPRQRARSRSRCRAPWRTIAR